MNVRKSAAHSVIVPFAAAAAADAAVVVVVAFGGNSFRFKEEEEDDGLLQGCQFRRIYRQIYECIKERVAIKMTQQ